MDSAVRELIQGVSEGLDPAIRWIVLWVNDADPRIEAHKHQNARVVITAAAAVERAQRGDFVDKQRMSCHAAQHGPNWLGSRCNQFHHFEPLHQ